MYTNDRIIGTIKKAAEQTARNIAEKENVDFTDLILGSDYRSIGDTVYVNDEIPNEVALAAVSICRRRFKVQDIVVLVVLDEEREGEAGIAFTKNKFYYWEEDENYKGEIPYIEIGDVDYEDDVVEVNTAKERMELFCSGEYGVKCRYLYNFLMDLKEGVENYSK